MPVFIPLGTFSSCTRITFILNHNVSIWKAAAYNNFVCSGHCRMACVASLQRFRLDCRVCCSHGKWPLCWHTHESWCNVRLRNCFHVVYWTAEPSHKQIIFFIHWLMLPFKESRWISLEKMTLFSAVWNNCQISMFYIQLQNHCADRSLSSLADLCFLLRKVWKNCQIFMSDSIRNMYFKVNGKGVNWWFSIVWVVHKFCLTNKGMIVGKVAYSWYTPCNKNG